MHVSTTKSLYARWRTLPVGKVKLTGGFWFEKQAINRRVSLRHGYRMLVQSGNLNNLRLAVGAGEGAYRGPVFMDSDVYKWLEAASLDLANDRDPELEALVDEVIALVAAAQQPDGYINSYYQVNKKPEDRWTNLDHDHELYCAGHLFEAAVAHHRATGKRELLDVACRFADCIDGIFGPGKRDGAPGHPEIELALVELYRESGEQRYLNLAIFFIDARGKGRMRGYGRWGAAYHQDHVPVREALEVVGHAVRQLYLTAGVADAYLETGEQALMDALLRLWHDATARKMHLTGGYGARHEGEAFGHAYELPSDECYCETCAAIAAMMWNWRMLLATGDPRYADTLERSLYNGFLSGVSLDGQRYFYVNPLQSRGGIARPEWYGCACCPPNVMRQIALVGNYMATTDETGIQVHQYASATIEAAVGDERVVLQMDTRYPWEGHVRVTVAETRSGEWTLAFRVPGWCNHAALWLNGDIIAGGASDGNYVTLTRAWQPGDVVELDLEMHPRLTAPNPRVDAIRGSLAIERGPLVYCLEEEDQEAGVDLLDVRLLPDAELEAEWRDDLLGGVVTVSAEGYVADVQDWETALYRPVPVLETIARPVKLLAVPYYAWANRTPGTMRVWIPQARP
ncbi:MAG: beta-L-arabinofuranosidase domain-containing protein [Anaerolineae bacterium]|mgnify:CR=1 FL=1